MEENNEELVVELKKIPLEELINILIDLHEKGADFIDIVAKPNEVQDTFGIIVKEEYISSGNNQFEEEMGIPNEPLTDLEELI